MRAFRTMLLAATASLLSLTAGCSEGGGPTQPLLVEAPARLAVQAASAGGGKSYLDPLARYRQKPSITIAWAKSWIGPEGGRLEFEGFVVEVPRGAVQRTTQFSIRLPVDPQGSERVVAEFGPHDVRFAVPVAIELPYHGTSIEGDGTPSVVWWNGVWVDMGGEVTRDGLRLRTTTTHFSTYGTTTEVARGTGMAASGG